VGLLTGFGEEVATEPENLEEALRGLLTGSKILFDLAFVELSITMGASRRVSVVYGSPDGCIEEFSILRGKLVVGYLKACPVGRGPLPVEHREELRAVAAVVGLALDAAHARELAAQRAAHGSVVQIASEALGTTLDERELYRTVLVLTLELLEASGGAVLLDDDDVVSLGFEGAEVTLAELGRVRLEGRSPWMGRLGRYHVVGVGLDREGGAVFLARKERPYNEAEGISLKLVARQLAHARERSRLYASLERTSMEAISALAAALESRDGTTGEHIMRTQTLAGAVARRLGFTPVEVRTAQYAAVLHDIGKIGIPDSILNKPGKLTQEEWRLMRRHPQIGAEIVGKISGFAAVAQTVLAHHERYDGGGYPAALARSEIPAGARLTSVLDAYDAMTNDRPYRKALSHEEALAELEAGAGSQFDPAVVEALKAVLLEKEQQS